MLYSDYDKDMSKTWPTRKKAETIGFLIGLSIALCATPFMIHYIRDTWLSVWLCVAFMMLCDAIGWLIGWLIERSRH